MVKDQKPSTLQNFDERLSAAQRRRDDKFGEDSDKGGKTSGQGGIGFAFKIGADIVAALIVGVGIGLILDSWLETKPWFLVLFFVLGAAAGRGFEMTAGYSKPGGKATEPNKEP